VDTFASALGPRSGEFVFWRVRLNLEGRVELPEFAGSLVRGALGLALRQVSCTTGAPTCTGCPEIPVCPYGYAFETPLPAGDSAQALGPFVPHPFALALEHPQDALALELTLVGRGRRYLASFVEAVRWLARRGLGHDRAKLALASVEDLAPAGPRTILTASGLFTSEPTDWHLTDLARPVPGAVALVTRSPLRLLAKGEPAEELDLEQLLRALFRRIGALARFHCGFEPEVDYRAELERARGVAVAERRLVWSERSRYSARQKRRMVLGGLEGTLVLDGDLTRALPFLALGECLQVGKGTSFGLGRYRLEAR
jgi:hypothetical protein